MQPLFGQKIYLNITSETKQDVKLIDSLGYTKAFENYITLKEEVESFKSELQELGYIDTALKQLSKKNDSTYQAMLNIGKPIKQIRIYYPQDFDISLLNFIPHKLNTNYFEVEFSSLQQSLNILNLKIVEQGDPFSTLQLISLSKENSEVVSAKLEIKTKKKRQIDNVIVKGYEKFSKSFVKHFLKLKNGNSFNLTNIKDNLKAIDNIPFADIIKPPEVFFTNDSTTVYLYLKKTPTNSFDGFLGFGTNEQTNKLEFDGYLDLKLRNNLNFGETLNLFYKSDEIDQQTFNVSVDAPYLFGSAVGLDTGLKIFKKDSTFLNTNQFAKINYTINSKHKIGLGISTNNSSNLLENDTAELTDYSSNFYTLGYNFINPNYTDPLFPINFYFNVTFSLGERDDNQQSLNQNLYSIDTYKIFNFNERNSIFTRLNSYILTSDSYLNNELFRFGGINSIRGFEENSLVANLFSVLNTEYRYKLNTTIYVHSVIDAAYYENQLIDKKEKLFGFGFGFGLITNAGLFRFNYSTAKTETSSIDLSNSKIHISLTAKF